MEVNIPKDICEAIGLKRLEQFGLDPKSNRLNYYDKSHLVELHRYKKEKVEMLLAMIAPYKHIRGAGVLCADIGRWLQALESGAADVRSRSVKQFTDIIKKLLADTPGQRLFQRDDDRGVWFCYYVGKVVYHPPRKDIYGSYPPYCELETYYYEYGVIKQSDYNFYPQDCLGQTAREALRGKNFVPENDEMRALYLAEHERFNATTGAIGKQFFATGKAEEREERRSGWWYSYYSEHVRLDKNGEPSRVVVDVFHESDKEERGAEHAKFDPWFWKRTYGGKSANDDEEEGTVDEDLYSEKPEIEVPVHPMTVVFDLRRHKRFEVHVSQMVEYVYDVKLSEKLILPPQSRSLINVLLKRQTGFKDIVAKKGGGATVLLAGAPGTGKTLTAEVFAEGEQRPLYTVQASQLGTDEEKLEENLLKIFARAERWSAILLIDEADVYVMRRGNSLQQNAIVGVFLRTLEYFNGVAFFTTNRKDLVDDAVLSRCIACIDYSIPTTSEQARIWRVLSRTSGISISDETIALIVSKHPRLSGRDVKQLLKLGGMVVAEHPEKQVSPEVISFVKRFKPTVEDNIQTDCPGPHKCHGTMVWCAECGDVSKTCDDVSCSWHNPPL